MNYRQLSTGQRYQIALMRKEGTAIQRIAELVGIHRSTVYRELKRNRECGSSYDPDIATELALTRRKAARKYQISEAIKVFVRMALMAKWSPEQISGVCKMMKHPVSHEWIYQFIARDKGSGGKLYKQLRQGHRRYRKGRNTKRAPLIDTRSIEDRPAIVNEKSRLGDWEIDTVLGKQGTGAIVTLAERKSKLYLIRKVPDKTAASVTKAVINMLRPYRKHVKTITSDNGTEFAGHKEIEQKLSAKVYFAHPYCAWERGLNENFNGLLRQYIPKGTDLRTLTRTQIKDYEKALNLRPRKCLGYQQPAKVFEMLRQAA